MSLDEEAKFEINIEGTIYPWNRSTITVPELRELAGIPVGQEMVEIDLATNVEHTLREDAEIHLEPGKGYAKKVRYQRG